MTISNPKQGDRFWTMLRRVTHSNNIVADSPYDRDVFVDRESIESRTPIEVPPQPVRSATAINPNIKQAAFVEVISINSQIITETVQMVEWPNACPRELKKRPGEINPNADSEKGSIFESRREESIEWRGTGQNINTSKQDTEARKNTFSEQDIRGDKNDLL